MKFRRDDPANPNVILLNCCMDMGNRFRKLAMTYELRGDHSTAVKLDEQAREQFTAMHRAEEELKLAG